MIKNIFAVAIILGLTACGGDAPPAATVDTAPVAQTAAPAPAAPAPVVAAPIVAATSGFGVAECDAFLSEYTACVTKFGADNNMTAEQLAQFNVAIEGARTSITSSLKQPGVTPETMAQSCKAMSDGSMPTIRAQFKC